MDFGDRNDNPFSARSRPDSADRKQAWKSSLRFFLLVALCLAVSLVVAGGGKKWLANRLMRDFDSLRSSERQERLVQIADLGMPGLPFLVDSLGDEEPEVGRTAYELLQEAQNDWTVLEVADRTAAHGTLVSSIKRVAADLPEDRTGWATRLVQQTLMASVNSTDDAGRELFQAANDAMELLALTHRSGSGPSPDQLADENQDSTPRRLQVRAQPLPVGYAGSTDRWTQWPPENERRFGDTTAESQMADGQSNDLPPSTVYRSGPRLSRVPNDGDIPLVDVPQRSTSRGEDSAANSDLAGNVDPPSDDVGAIQPVAHLVDSPLETYSDQSVLHWLSSEHTALRAKAESELRRRGYSAKEISIARQFANADVTTRIGLIDVIAQSDQIDPRPWLLMLLDDPSRDVKLRAVSVLATMNDPSITQRLRMHLVDERDPTVAARIRRVLKLR